MPDAFYRETDRNLSGRGRTTVSSSLNYWRLFAEDGKRLDSTQGRRKIRRPQMRADAGSRDGGQSCWHLKSGNSHEPQVLWLNARSSLSISTSMYPLAAAICAAVFAWLATTSTVVAQWECQYYSTGSNFATSFYGYSAAISGNTAIIGEYGQNAAASDRRSIRQSASQAQ